MNLVSATVVPPAVPLCIWKSSMNALAIYTPRPDPAIAVRVDGQHSEVSDCSETVAVKRNLTKPGDTAKLKNQRQET
jgi:hypothetical protein